MKWVSLSLIALLTLLQYKLWCEADGVHDWWHLKQAITAQNLQNIQLTQRNTLLSAEIEDLKHGEDAIQEHARNDLGMVSQGEVFYQILDK